MLFSREEKGGEGGAAIDYTGTVACSPELYAQLFSALGSNAAAGVQARVLCFLLLEKAAEYKDRTESVGAGVNFLFLLFSGALVFLMHGACRAPFLAPSSTQCGVTHRVD